MQAHLFEFKRFAVHDGDGIRTTVFFKGCSLHCKWCHNPESISPNPQLGVYNGKCIHCGACETVCQFGAQILTDDGLHTFNRDKCRSCGACAKVCPSGALEFYGEKREIDLICRDLLEDKPFYDATDGGITLSGGECLLQPEECAELLRKMKEYGIHTAVDTCGQVPKSALDAAIPYTDVFLYDIKHIDSAKHKAGTGTGNELILSNLQYLSNRGQNIEIRIPLIIGYNDDAISDIGEYLKEIPGIVKIKVLAYHDYARGKYKAIGAADTLPEMPENNGLEKAISQLRGYGLTVTV